MGRVYILHADRGGLALCLSVSFSFPVIMFCSSHRSVFCGTLILKHRKQGSRERRKEAELKIKFGKG